ncbi:MAG: thiamine pyrophosphate-dependent enzyme, partial [Burkholderiaceae bacterium]
ELGRGPNPGPIHLNVPLSGRFDALETKGEPSAGTRAVVAELRERTNAVLAEAAALQARQLAAPSRIAALATTLPLRRGLRGVIIAGPECGVDVAVLESFCASTGYPVIADAASGLRGSTRIDAMSGYDALVARCAYTHVAPDFVIRFGHAPVMPCVQDYLLTYQVPTLKCSPVEVVGDYLHSKCSVLVAPTANELTELAARLGPGAPEWREMWKTQASGVRNLRNVLMDHLLWGELSAVRAVFAHPGFDLLQIGNSMAVRHADMMEDGKTRRSHVLSNRGVCGIDGTVGGFLGAAQATGCEAGLLVLGDLAMLHDLPALATAQRHAGSACIVVVNNEGGGIFDMLPMRSLADFSAIRNSHEVDFCAIAAGFGLSNACVKDAQSLQTALDAACQHQGVSLIEIKVKPDSAREQVEVVHSTLALLDAPLAPASGGKAA